MRRMSGRGEEKVERKNTAEEKERIRSYRIKPCRIFLVLVFCPVFEFEEVVVVVIIVGGFCFSVSCCCCCCCSVFGFCLIPISLPVTPTVITLIIVIF